MEIQTQLTKNILTKAFQELYPIKTIPKLTIKYSNRFSDYNGNVKYERFGRTITGLHFALSKKFKDCEDEIQIGIVQELINKVYKTKIQTLNQDLYHSFTKHISNYTKKGESHPFLKELFEELKEEYFQGLIDEPTLRLGKESYRTLGHYNYNKDTVTISRVFMFGEEPRERELIKYVLYHELLHKKHKFVKVNNQHRHHTPAFKRDERKYHDKNIENKLKIFLSKKKLKKELISPFEKILKRFF